ncbi:MAG: hypothetical protein FJ221_14210 [Lentisphaerae bacterium]|nr:hypothetical protein [Lentisphaerota bacterium]
MKATLTLIGVTTFLACLSLPAQDKLLPPGDHMRTLAVDGRQRSYLLHVPPGAAAGQALPLVIMLHGGGGTADNAAKETGWSAKADEAGFLVAYPNATPADPGEPAAFRGNPQTWNDGSGRFKKEGGEPDDVAFISAMIDDIGAQTALDRKRVFVAGFSNGASMAFAVGAGLPDRVTAIAPVAGACWLAELKLKRGVPLCYITGAADPLNPLSGGPLRLGLGGRDKPPVQDSILKWVKAVGAPVEPTETRETNGIRTLRYGPGRDGAGVVFITIEGQGHVWPGGRNLLPETLVGQATGKLKAVDVIWDFFSAQTPPPGSGSPNTEGGLHHGDHTRTVKVGNLQRRYLVHVPPGYDAAKATPVVIAFHGGGGNPASMVRLSGLNAKSDAAGFIVAYPYGTGRLENQFLTFNAGGCCGYAMENKIDDVGFTRALIDDLATVVTLDTNRVFATGLSNGGIMAHYLASELSDRIAAIAPVGGPLMMDACRPRRAVSVMHFHGTGDEFAPFKGGFGKGAAGGKGVTDFKSVDFTIKNWVKANSCDARPEIVPLPDKADDGMRVTRKTWSGGKDGSEVVLIEIEGGGHTWPGREPPVAMLGKSTMDISANDLMWEFFQAHPLKPSVAPPPAADNAPGRLKTLPDSDATRDAAGTGQMFEAIHVPGFTDFREGLNGFALGDFDRNGYLDILTVTTEPFALDGRSGDETNAVKRTRDPKDKLRLLLNFGGFRLQSQAVTLTGSAATPDDLSQGWRGGQVPALADFNGDGLLDVFITRQAPMSNGKIREGFKPIGCSLFLSDGRFDRFRDGSLEYGALNELAYNRQVSLGDVNRDGFLDIALGADNVVSAFEGLPKSVLYVFQPKDGEFEGGKFKDIGGTDLVPDFGGFHHDSARDKAGPNLALRDMDNDGDLDLLQSTHVLINGRFRHGLPYSPGEYRQGVFTWRNLLKETGEFRFEKSAGNGLAVAARLRFDEKQQRFVPAGEARAPGLAYLLFGDVDNDGLYDVIAVDGSDATFTPKTEDVGGRFWLNKGGFRFEEATARCGLASLNNRYADWYEFFEASVSPALLQENELQAFRVSQPGLEPVRAIDLRPYHADVIFADFNNDTWLDFVIPDRREPKAIETRCLLFMNQGNGVFKPVPTTVSGLNGSGICGEAADLNNDGLVDLLIAADPDNSGIASDLRRYESMVFLNTGLHGGRTNHWLRLRFSGITHARLLGARIEVLEPGSTKRLGTRGIYSNHSYKSGSPMEAHFGLGITSHVDVSVHLPGGEHFTVKNVQGDRYLDLNVPERAVREVL